MGLCYVVNQGCHQAMLLQCAIYICHTAEQEICVVDMSSAGGNSSCLG
jgi:hypothetical protein